MSSQCHACALRCTEILLVGEQLEAGVLVECVVSSTQTFKGLMNINVCVKRHEDRNERERERQRQRQRETERDRERQRQREK